MKRIIVFLVIGFSTTAMADNYTAGEVMSFCGKYSKDTEQIMTQRQRGEAIDNIFQMHINDSVNSVNRAREIKTVIESAYSQPIQKSDVAKFGVIKRFRDRNMMKCLGNHYAIR